MMYVAVSVHNDARCVKQACLCTKVVVSAQWHALPPAGSLIPLIRVILIVNICCSLQD